MKARRAEEQNVRYMGTRELCTYLSVGQSTARKIGEKAGARVKLGRRVLFDMQAIDTYIEGMRESKGCANRRDARIEGMRD